MKNILITGGTGLIGKRLSHLLSEKGYTVRLLSRKQNNESKYETFLWDIDSKKIDEKAFEDLDYIIHLAGAGIADKRWSPSRKKILIDSRVESTNLLVKTVEKLQTPIQAFIASSAIGYYGSVTSDVIFSEEDSSGNDFLSNVCKSWEEASFQFQKQDIRTVAIRTGIVLSKEGGALSKMKTPIITPLGNGKQYMPWIHIDDVCNIYIKAIEDTSMQGIYNGVAPEHLTNTTFSKTIAKVYKRPYLPIAVPSFILKLFFGEMATILLNGSKISSKKTQENDFNFKFKKLEKALFSLRKNS